VFSKHARCADIDEVIVALRAEIFARTNATTATENIRERTEKKKTQPRIARRDENSWHDRYEDAVSVG